MKKFYLAMMLATTVLFSGCSFFEEEEQIDIDNVKAYDIHDAFKGQYQALKNYVETHSYDGVGQEDFKKAEANYFFMRDLLNEGIACADPHYYYDDLGHYFPWYKTMQSLVSETLKLQEFCYSNLTGFAIFSYLDASQPSTNQYSFYGYLRLGETKKYYDISYDQDVECELGDWNNDNFTWSCTYKDARGILNEDKYSYDFFFETGTLLETCKGEGENQVCEPVI